MNDKEIIEHLKRIKECPISTVCEVCRGWLLQIIFALEDKEQ